MGIEQFIGQHCEACGEGSLQAKNTVLNLKHKGVPIKVECQIPSCTICGASLLPSYLKKEIKEKRIAAYNEIVKPDYLEGIKYKIEVKALVNGEFKSKVSEINPNRHIEGFNGEFLEVNMGQLIKSFNKVLYLLDAPNFVISKRTFIASYVISDLKIDGLIDHALLYEHVHDFIPHEMASHIDYMTILSDEPDHKKVEKEKQLILRVYRDDNQMRKYKTYDYSLLRTTLGAEVVNVRGAYTIITPSVTYLYYTVDSINTNPPIGFNIDKLQLFNVHESETPIDHIKTRFKQDWSIEYLKL